LFDDFADQFPCRAFETADQHLRHPQFRLRVGGIALQRFLKQFHRIVVLMRSRNKRPHATRASVVLGLMLMYCRNRTWRRPNRPSPTRPAHASVVVTVDKNLREAFLRRFIATAITLLVTGF